MDIDNFDDKAKRGREGELQAFRIMRRNGKYVRDCTADDFCRKWDVDCKWYDANGTRAVEVKTDDKAAETGNLFVEYENINNASHGGKGWYYYSACDIICFLVNNTLHCAPMASLKAYCKKYTNLATGWSGNSHGWLIPLWVFKNFDGYFSLT